MTAQMPDVVIYQRRKYALAGVKGNGLFNPVEQQIKPVACSTACWRGFICTYAVSGRRLLLDRLDLNVEGPSPIVFGINPAKDRQFVASYRRVRRPQPYTGGLLIAREFIRDLYVHMGFHPAWKYQEVHELIFRDGELIEETDRSNQMAELRRQKLDSPMRPGLSATTKDIEKWVNRCFSLDYT